MQDTMCRRVARSDPEAPATGRTRRTTNRHSRSNQTMALRESPSYTVPGIACRYRGGRFDSDL